MLALSILAGTVAPAFADELIKNCYTADNAELLDEYINAYGWDKEKMMAKNWTDNGKEYKRQVGGQREYLADCFKGTDDFLMSEPEFGKDNKIIYMPYEASNVLGAVAAIKDLTGGAPQK